MKKDFISVQKYGLKLTYLSRYAPEIVKDMRRKMSMFVAGLGHPSSKEGRADMLVGDMEISKMMVYVQHVEEKKVKDREDY